MPPGSVELDLALPCAIKDGEAGAKFDKKAHVLTLTLPLAEPAAATSAPAPPVPTPPAPAPATAPAPPPAAPLAPANQATAEVPVEWRQNAQYVALILQVPGVVKASVDAKFEARSVRLRFESMPPGASSSTPLKHALTLHLHAAVDTEGCRYDAADNNMMVVLPKKSTAAGEAEWPALEAPGSATASAAVASTPLPDVSEPGSLGMGSLAIDRGGEGRKKASAPSKPAAAPKAKPAAAPAKPAAAPSAQPAAGAAGKPQYDKLLFELD